MQARHLTALCMLVSVCHMRSFLIETLGRGSEDNIEAGSEYYDNDYGDYANNKTRMPGIW